MKDQLIGHSILALHQRILLVSMRLWVEQHISLHHLHMLVMLYATCYQGKTMSS
jgi:hypothetical protein